MEIELPDVDCKEIPKRHLCGVSFVTVTARNEDIGNYTLPMLDKEVLKYAG